VCANAAGLEAPRDGGLWVVQVLGATLLLTAGLTKLSGDEQMIETFAAIGIGQWFHYATGLIEFASAILLLIPALTGIGALLVIPIIIGTIVTHVLIIGGSPVLPIGLLIVVSVVAWGRRETTRRLISCNKPLKELEESETPLFITVSR
jgi:putative oxidoreductase